MFYFFKIYYTKSLNKETNGTLYIESVRVIDCESKESEIIFNDIVKSITILEGLAYRFILKRVKINGSIKSLLISKDFIFVSNTSHINNNVLLIVFLFNS